MAHRPVGLGNSIAISSGSATTSSSSFPIQSNVLRVVAVSAGTHVAIGTNPTATSSDYYIPANQSATIALSPASQRVSGVTTGSTTILDFPEGTESPFVVGDYVTLTSVGQSYYNFTHQPIIAVNSSSNYQGYFSTRVSIGTNTSGIVTAFIADGNLRKSVKISAYGTGSGALYYQQVQISGDA